MRDTPGAWSAVRGEDESRPLGRQRGQWLLGISLLLALLSAVYARPIWLGEVFYRRDIARYIYPIYAHLRTRLRAGQWPLWDPHEFGGAPFLGDVTNAVFYPPNVLLLGVSPATAITLLIVGHHVLAALGVALLLRRFGSPVAVSLAAGVCFSLSGYAMAMDNSMTYLTGLCWAPWILWSLDRLLQHPSAARAGVLAALYACLFTGGDLQWTYLAVLLSCAYTLASVRPSLRVLLWLCGAACLCLGLSCVQLLPLVSIVRASERWGGLPLAEAQAWSLHPMRVLELVLAHPFGVLSEQSFWGQAFVGSATHSTPWSNGLYIGAAVPVLALFARRDARSCYFWTVAGLALVLALGSHAPLDRGFRAVVPGWSAFRYPEKLMSVVTLGLCVAAGLGLGRLLQAPAHTGLHKRALIGLGVATAGSLLLVVSMQLGASAWLAWVDRTLRDAGSAHVARTTALDLLRASALRATASFACASALAWLGGRSDQRRQLLAFSWFALLAIDVGTASARLVDSAPAELYRAPVVAAQRIQERVGAGPPYRIYGAPLAFAPTLQLRPEALNPYYMLWMRQTLAPKTGVELGLRYATGYSATTSREFGLFWSTISRVPDDRALDLMAVRFVIDSERAPRYVDPTRYRVLVALPYLGIRVLELVHPTPLARVVHRVRRARSHEQARTMLAVASFDARNMAVVEQDVDIPDEGVPADSVRHLVDSSEEEVVETRLERRGLLVLSESYHPNWHVWLDGRPVPLLRVNYLQRGVLLEPGIHRVRLLYEDRSLLYGAWLTGLTLLLLLLITLHAYGFGFGRTRDREGSTPTSNVGRA